MKSPIKATGYRVVIRQNEVEERSEGGIIKATSKEISRQQTGQFIGVLCHIGSSAFTGEDFGDEDRKTHVAGVTVIYQRHAGNTYSVVDDDCMYHVCSDSDVQGIPSEGVTIARDGS